MKENIKKSIKNAKELFIVQLQISKMGAVYQVLYTLTTAFKPFIFILFPMLIIEISINQEVASRLLLSIFLISLCVWGFELIILLTESIQSIYNLKFNHYFKKKIAYKAMIMDYKDTENAESLDLLESAKEAIWELSGSLITDLLGYLLKLVFLFVIMSTLHPLIALFTLSIVIAIYFINRYASTKNNEYDIQKSKFSREKRYAEEFVLDFELGMDIRIYNGAGLFVHKHAEAVKKIIDIQKKQNNFNLFITVVTSFLSTLVLGVTYVYLIRTYNLGLIAISSFLVYIAAVAEFYKAIDAVFFMFLGFYEINMSVDRYETFMNIPEEINAIKNNSTEISEIKTIEFRNVSFCYPGQDNYALKNINLKLHAPENIMICGDNGAGKSTFFKLLLRLYDIEEGEILVNDINIKQILYKDYIRCFSTVFQDAMFFAYSVKENIVFDEENPDEAAVLQSLYDSGLKLEELPHGLDTYITKEFDSNGVNLSGGQIQKIMTARAFYKNGDVLILDEPNSKLDPLAEAAMVENLLSISKNKLTLFVSHRLTMGKDCDKILVFDNAEIVETGSHKELMSKEDLYYRMFNMQANYYKDVIIT